MNSKGEENRSVRLTRKRLSDALITLLMQKPVREITVRELTELANRDGEGYVMRHAAFAPTVRS